MADETVIRHILCPDCTKEIAVLSGRDAVLGCPKKTCPFCGQEVYVSDVIEPAVKEFSDRYSEYYLQRKLVGDWKECNSFRFGGWILSYVVYHLVWPFLLKIWWAFSPNSYQRWREKLASKALFKVLRDTGEVWDSFIRMSEADYVDWLAEHTEVPDWFLRRAEHIRKTGEWPEGEQFASLVPEK